MAGMRPLALALLVPALASAANVEALLEVNPRYRDDTEAILNRRLQGIGVHGAVFSGKGKQLKISVSGDPQALALALGERGQLWLRRVDERSPQWNALVP